MYIHMSGKTLTFLLLLRLRPAAAAAADSHRPRHTVHSTKRKLTNGLHILFFFLIFVEVNAMELFRFYFLEFVEDEKRVEWGWGAATELQIQQQIFDILNESGHNNNNINFSSAANCPYPYRRPLHSSNLFIMQIPFDIVCQ